MADEPIREWNSEAYHRLSEPQAEWGRKVLARLKLAGTETAMDAGCGSGRLTAELAARLDRGRVVGVDLSENMLRTARERLPAALQPRVAFVRAELERLPFDSCFDLIFSTATFHWLTDHDRLFRGLYHALTPGGWLAAQCGGGPNLTRLLRRVEELMQRPEYRPAFAGWPTPWLFADERTTAARLAAAGFTRIETQLEQAPYTPGSIADYREFLANIVLRLHLPRIADSGLRERFLDALVQQAESSGDFELDYWRMNFRARRPAG